MNESDDTAPAICAEIAPYLSTPHAESKIKHTTDVIDVRLKCLHRVVHAIGKIDSLCPLTLRGL